MKYSFQLDIPLDQVAIPGSTISHRIREARVSVEVDEQDSTDQVAQIDEESGSILYQHSYNSEEDIDSMYSDLKLIIADLIANGSRVIPEGQIHFTFLYVDSAVRIDEIDAAVLDQIKTVRRLSSLHQ